MAKRKLVIHQEAITEFLKENRMVVVDGGGRGALFQPFDRIPQNLRTVLRFEPDPDAEIIKSDNEIIFNKGLWNKEETVSLHLAKVPSTSSVYPPNKQLLDQFDDRIGFPPRATQNILKVEGINIDGAMQGENLSSIDFIKLDVHGAEYEAIEGASGVLSNCCVGLMVESWLVEVHSGQRLIFDVEKEMARYGYYKFGSTQVISWPRKRMEKLRSRKQIVGEENVYLLLCSSAEDAEKLGMKRALKLSIVADLFGYTDYAIQIIELCHKAGFLSKEDSLSIVNHIQRNNKMGFTDKVLTKAIHVLQNKRDNRL